MTALAKLNLDLARYKANKQAQATLEFSKVLAQLWLDGVLSDNEYNQAAALYRAVHQTEQR